MSFNPHDRLGHYVLLERAGAGGMGVVWKARDTRLDRIVAIKVLPEAVATDPDRVARLEEEARALAAVHHSGIVTVFAIEEAEGTRFIAMEFVEGVPLADFVPPEGLPLESCIDVGMAIAAAVGAAHAHGIVHRDLKPGNVIVTPEAEVKVLDFGIAGWLHTPDTPPADAPTRRPTEVGRVVGTPPFMSPEQALGAPVDHRSDIFSLGALLYLMATGRVPFPGRTDAEVLAAVLRDAPIAVDVLRSDAPASLVRTIERCLAKNPALRLPSAIDVCQALHAARQDLAGGAGARVRSIAVLPFDDLSPEKDQDYFCEGIADEILLALTRLTGLRVVSRSAAFAAHRQVEDPRQLGVRLGVDTLLEGSVRKAGRRLRVSVALTDVRGGFHLWTERYDRDLEDVFAVQDEIAHAVARALCGTLTAGDRDALRRDATPKLQAFDLYLRGRQFFWQFSGRGMEFALAMFDQALAIDPQYARAHAGVAECHAFLYLYRGRDPAHLTEADAASRRAIDLAPDSAEAHTARGVALTLRQALDEAEREFQAAITLDPRLFDAHYAYARMCFADGRDAEAARLWERAQALRPDDYQSPLLIAQAYERLERAADATRARERGVAIAEQHLALHPDDVRALYMGANGLVALGERDKGLAWARRALALEPDEPMLLYNIACIYSLASLPDEALACLEQAVTKGLTQREWLLHDANLDPLRALPRFERLMAALASAG